MSTMTPAPGLARSSAPADAGNRRFSLPSGKGSTSAPAAAPKPTRAPRTRQQDLMRGALMMLAAVLAAFLVHILLLSHLEHMVAQTQLRSHFVQQLSTGEAPVGEADVNNRLLRDGVPVARLEIPALHVNEIIVEGTSSSALRSGPGHRRDTALPGQPGTSVIMGRASAYGGPFGRIHELKPGERFSVITGQGEHIYEVVGLRYAGDLKPRLTPGASMVVLETAKGAPYTPAGVTRVDAKLLTPVFPKGARDTTLRGLPAEDRSLAGDFSTLWQLVFALQFLVLVEVALVWLHRRIGLTKTWAVSVPVLILAIVLVSDQIIKLLPNLL